MEPGQVPVDFEHGGQWVEGAGLVYQTIHMDGKVQGRENLSIHGLPGADVKVHGF